MAIKKIEIRPKGLDGTYADVLYPKTSTDMVEGLSTALSGKSDTSHTHTSSQVGLGSVPNYGVATQAEAQAGTSNVKFMTPLRVKEAVQVLAPTPTASSVPIVDSGNFFTSTNVEGAMAELFQNVSDGKTSIATAITGKGVTASGSDTHAQLATKVGQIVTDPSVDATANASDISLGHTAYSKGQKLTGTMANNTGNDIWLYNKDETYTIPAGRHYGTGKVKAVYPGASGSMATKKTLEHAMKSRGVSYDEDYRQTADGGYVEYVFNRNGYSGRALRWYNASGVLIKTLPLSLNITTIYMSHLIDDDELQVMNQYGNIWRYNFNGVLLGTVNVSSLNSPFCAFQDSSGAWFAIGNKGDGVITNFNIFDQNGTWRKGVTNDDNYDQYSFARKLASGVYAVQIRSLNGRLVASYASGVFDIYGLGANALLSNLGRR